jgi:hypothetical protein
MIMYQDWNETWVPPRTATAYYEGVVKTMGGESKTKDFFRLFMILDYGMCAAMFPGTFDALGALQKWVEEGVAPDHIRTTCGEQGSRFRERAGMQDTPQSKRQSLIFCTPSSIPLRATSRNRAYPKQENRE